MERKKISKQANQTLNSSEALGGLRQGVLVRHFRGLLKIIFSSIVFKKEKSFFPDP